MSLFLDFYDEPNLETVSAKFNVTLRCAISSHFRTFYEKIGMGTRGKRLDKTGPDGYTKRQPFRYGNGTYHNESLCRQIFGDGSRC